MIDICEKQAMSSRQRTQKDFAFSLNTTSILMLILIGALGIYYVWSLNVNATKWYAIRQLEIEKRELIVEQEILDVRVAETESLNYVLHSEVSQGMYSPENVDYIVIRNEAPETFALNQ